MELDEQKPIVSDQEAPVTENEESELASDEEDQGPLDLDAIDGVEESADSADVDPEDVEAQPETEPMIEMEIDGKVYQIPEAIKDGYLKNADYTQKTQKVSDQRKQVEQLYERAKTIHQVGDAEVAAMAQLRSVESNLERYTNVDWNAWEAQDPIAAQSGWREYQQLKDAKGETSQALHQAQTQRQTLEAQDFQQRQEATRQFASQQIKDWTPEVDKQIEAFVFSEIGLKPEQVTANLSPELYKMAHLAMRMHQSEQRAKSKVATRPTAKQPLKKVSARSSGVSTKDPADMSMEEYAKWSASQFKD